MMETRKVSVRFALALGILLAVNALTFHGARRVMRSAEQVAATHEVLEQIQQAMGSLSEAEGARRGYLLTRDPSHLEAYRSSIKSADERVENLRRLTQGQSAHRAKMDALDGRVHKLETLLDRSVAAAQKGTLSGKANADATKRAKEGLDEIRALLSDEMGREEQKLLEEGNRAQRAGGRITLWALVLGTLLSFGLIVSAYRRLTREARERLRAEEATKVLNAELQKVNAELETHLSKLSSVNIELETINQFMTYDLRTPLSVIYGFSSVLLEHYSAVLDSEGLRSLEAIHRNATKMKQMMEDLIAFSQANRQVLNPAPIDMEGLAQEIYRELSAPQPPAARQFKAAGLPQAHADPNMIRRVLSHVLANAIKFSRNREAPSIEVGGRREGGENVYFVRDNGAGFDMKQAHKLFGVFQRLHTRNEFEGNGIGLAIVKKVIDRHGGRVWAEGRAGQGATFYFTLPEGERALSAHGR